MARTDRTMADVHCMPTYVQQQQVYQINEIRALSGFALNSAYCCSDYFDDDNDPYQCISTF
eukprot:scaffold44391_cov18-Prasinocladus_malaysianus.AAC.1